MIRHTDRHELKIGNAQKETIDGKEIKEKNNQTQKQTNKKKQEIIQYLLSRKKQLDRQTEADKQIQTVRLKYRQHETNKLTH